MKEIDLSTGISEINANYLSSNGCIRSKISSTLTKVELIELIEKHNNQLYSTALFQLIPPHQNTDDEVLLLLLDCTSNDTEVANAIATVAKTSKYILNILLKIESESVKEHVRWNLIDKKEDF